jgi:hypothetical protein
MIVRYARRCPHPPDADQSSPLRQGSCCERKFEREGGGERTGFRSAMTRVRQVCFQGFTRIRRYRALSDGCLGQDAENLVLGDVDALDAFWRSLCSWTDCPITTTTTVGSAPADSIDDDRGGSLNRVSPFSHNFAELAPQLGEIFSGGRLSACAHFNPG